MDCAWAICNPDLGGTAAFLQSIEGNGTQTDPVLVFTTEANYLGYRRDHPGKDQFLLLTDYSRTEQIERLLVSSAGDSLQKSSE